MTVENKSFEELSGDQRREFVNTQQRFDAFLDAQVRSDGYRGSMSFSTVGGSDYLVRSYYDPKSGSRRQKSLGPRDAENERIKAQFETGRHAATERLAAMRQSIERQAGINRVMGLGRVPTLSARIVRALDTAHLLGHGLRVVGTHALYAYEAAAGVRFSTDVTATEDIDLLFDARASLIFLAEEDIGERSLLGLLRRIDRSFERGRQTFKASNRDGFVVDLIRRMRSPPWRDERTSVAEPETDLDAVQIEGLIWNENAPAFRAVAIDQRGFPLRIVAPDPRAFAVHKFWLSRRLDRDPVKRRGMPPRPELSRPWSRDLCRICRFAPRTCGAFPKQSSEKQPYSSRARPTPPSDSTGDPMP